MKLYVESDLGCFVASSVVYSSARKIFGYPNKCGAICLCGGPLNTLDYVIFPLPSRSISVKKPSV